MEPPYSPADDTDLVHYEGHNIESSTAVESYPDTELDENFRLSYTKLLTGPERPSVAEPTGL